MMRTRACKRYSTYTQQRFKRDAKPRGDFEDDPIIFDWLAN